MKNPGAFLRHLPEAEDAMKVCGCEDPKLLSDYEFFSALCKAQKALAHHRLFLAAKALLAENGCQKSLSPANVDAVWRFFAEKTSLREPQDNLYAPDGGAVCLGKKIRARDYAALDRLLKEAEGARDCDSFQALLLEAFRASGRKGVLVDLPDEVYMKQPNLYQLELALMGKGDETVLSLQALRFFATEDVPLLLVLRGEGRFATGFLSCLDRLIGGLPPVCLVLSESSLDSGVRLLLSLGEGRNLATLQEKDSPKIAPLLCYRYPFASCALFLKESCRKSCKND